VKKAVVLGTDESAYNGQHKVSYVEASDPDRGTRVVHAIVTTRTPCGRLHQQGHLDYREFMAAQEYEGLFNDSGAGSISGMNPDGVPMDTVFKEAVPTDGQLRAGEKRREAEKHVGLKDAQFIYHVAGYGTEVEMVAWRYGKRPDEVRLILKRALSSLADLWGY